MRKMSILFFTGTVPISVYPCKLFLLSRVVLLTAVCKVYIQRIGRISLLSWIHTTGQKEKIVYLFKAISNYYENTAALHSSHRLKSHINFW